MEVKITCNECNDCNQHPHLQEYHFLYNPQNDFLGYSETKRPKFKAEKKNEMVF